MKFEIPIKEEVKMKGMTIKTESELIDDFTEACKKQGSNKTRIITAFMKQFVEVQNG